MAGRSKRLPGCQEVIGWKEARGEDVQRGGKVAICKQDGGSKEGRRWRKNSLYAPGISSG